MSVPKQSSRHYPKRRRGRGPWRFALPAVLLLFLLLALGSVTGCRRFDLSTVLDGASGLALTISPSSTTVEATTTLSFSAEGGVPPYSYSVVGAGTISTDGQYTAPASEGTDRVRVIDAVGKVDEASVEVTTFTGGLVISPSSLSLVVNGSATFMAIGGSGSYTFSVAADGSGGAVVNSSTGYYVAGGSPGTDTIQVSDGLTTRTATVSVSTVSTNVDYSIPSTSFASSGTAGSAMAAGNEFLLQNGGSSGGSLSVSWKVYLSANTTLDGGDVVVASGTTTALGAGADAAVAVSGSYPSLTGSYYLIAEVSAGDDMAAGNNTSSASAITLSPKNIDYDVLSVSHLSGDTAGGAVEGSFDYQNVGTYDGFFTPYYEVYASTDATLDGADTLVSTGTLGSLGAGAGDSKSFAGVWPTTAGSYYLIVKVDAQDDVAAGNDTQASASSVSVTGVTPADVDYVVDSVTNTGGTTTGEALSGEFVYKNQGADGGSETVYYNAYVSTDTTLDVGSDPMVDSGTVSPLAGGSTAAAPTAFSGSWPESPGTYYLIVRVSSSDDVLNSNNSRAGSAVTVSAPDIDYSLTSVSNVGGSTTGGSIDGELTVQNVGTAGGVQTAYWTAYLSTNTTLEIGTDPVLDSGTLGTLAAGVSSGPISFSGTWPSSSGTYYLIVQVAADDDIDASNNTGASGAVVVSAPNVDYYPTAITNTGGTATGGALSGEFAIDRFAGDPASDTVYWRAYVSSDAVLDIGTDQILDSGSIAPLSSGGSSGPIAFTGSWPEAPGPYCFILAVDAGDDINPGNDVMAGSAVTVTAPDVDYVVSSVASLGGTTTGGVITGEFQIENWGWDPGSHTVYWSAYVSTDAFYDPADTIIDSGSLSPLPGSGGIPVAFDGTWPSSAGTWYLIVVAEAADDVDALNNTKASAAVAVVSPLVYPDYEVGNVVVQDTGSPGSLFSAAGIFQFDVTEVAGNPGSEPIDWWIYVSEDQILDAGDILADSGTHAALAALGAATISFDGTWPSATGFYYLIICVSADDDSNPVGDQIPSKEIAVPFLFTESEPNDDNQKPFSLSDIDDLGAMNPGDLIAVSGIMDAANGYDTFRFQPADPTLTYTYLRVQIRCVWNTGFDDLDLRLWDDGGSELISQDESANSEPENPPWTIINLTVGDYYYVGVWTYLAGGSSGSTGQPYTLYIQTLP
ncbi:MAG: hypothetical protein JW820_05625 [Spirochaetales bacterium]|nr:hypothetical protein [Spirochaetales bacterium]